MPSVCGMFRYKAFTSIVANIEFVGVGVSSISIIKSPLSLMYDIMFGTCG